MPYANREDRINFLKKYYIKNREALKKATRDRRKNNPVKAKEIDRKAYLKNGFKKNLQKKLFRKNNNELVNAKSREHYLKNREKIRLVQNKLFVKNFHSKYRFDKIFMRKFYERNYARQVLKPKLIKKYGGCQVCNTMYKLEIHHKDYEYHTTNVLLLCNPCHRIADLC